MKNFRRIEMLMIEDYTKKCSHNVEPYSQWKKIKYISHGSISIPLERRYTVVASC